MEAAGASLTPGSLAVSGLSFGIISGIFSIVNILADSAGPGTVGIHGDSPYYFITSGEARGCGREQKEEESSGSEAPCLSPQPSSPWPWYCSIPFGASSSSTPVSGAAPGAWGWWWAATCSPQGW